MTQASWTGPADVRATVQRQWDRGPLMATRVPKSGISVDGDASIRRIQFPWRIRLRGPAASDLLHRWDAVRQWSNDWRRVRGVQLEMVTRNHQSLGHQELPSAVWLESANAAVALIRCGSQAAELDALIAETPSELFTWAARHPRTLLAVGSDWAGILAAAGWIRDHPDPGIFLRQVDAPGVHTKVVEQHRRTVSGLLDELGVPSAQTQGSGWFERRYGFRTKPTMVRMRFLDDRSQLIPGVSDMSVTASTFCDLDPPVKEVFVTENEINFLSLPKYPESMVVFGAGHSAPELVGAAGWLVEKRVRYWGDIDTHGFAILSRFRAAVPHTTSLLMDRETLLMNRDLWGCEDQQMVDDLVGLSAEEAQLYNDLRTNRLGRNLRLEQERIPFESVRRAL